VGIFSSRQHAIARYMLSPVRPSVCPACLSYRWISQKRIMQLSHQSSPMTLVSSWLTSPRNSKGSIGNWDAEWERVGKYAIILANMSPYYLRNGARYDQGYYDGLIGSRCAFDWHQCWWPWM